MQLRSVRCLKTSRPSRRKRCILGFHSGGFTACMMHACVLSLHGALSDIVEAYAAIVTNDIYYIGLLEIFDCLKR